MASRSKLRSRGDFNLDKFASRANEAAFWEAWVGAVLARCGLYTLHHPFTLAESLGEVAQFAGTWDMDVALSHPGAWEWNPPTETEVKSLSLDFTNTKDYPHETVLVCSANNQKKKYKQTDHTVREFLLVSRSTGSLVWVPSGTPLQTMTITDREKNETYKAVYCQKGDLRGIGGYVKSVTDKG